MIENRYLAILAVLAAITTLLLSTNLLVSDPPTPNWGGNPKYTVGVTTKYNGSSYNFTYYYDSTKKQERYEYGVGNNYHNLCWASGFANWQQTRCTAVYAPDGWWYVQFPDQNYCCKCINTFGPIRYDWVQQGSTYQGKGNVNGTVTDFWMKKGNMGPNYYHATATTAQLPVMFSETFSSGITKAWMFDLRTYSTAPIDPQKFAKPNNCDSRCQGQCPNINQNNVDEFFPQANI